MFTARLFGSHLLYALLAATTTFACQEGAVTRLSSDQGSGPSMDEGTSPATGAAASAGSTQTTADGLGPQADGSNPAPSDGAATPSPGEAPGQPDPTVPETGAATGGNETVGKNPNAATPASNVVPPDWSQFRYAFSSGVFSQWGGAGDLGLGRVDIRQKSQLDNECGNGPEDFCLTENKASQKILWQGGPGSQAEAVRTTENFSMQFFGFYRQGRPGAICRNTLANGILCSKGSPGGPSAVFGIGSGKGHAIFSPQ